MGTVLAEVQRQPSGDIGFESEADAVRDVTHVAPAWKPVPGPEGNPLAARPHPPEDVLLASLIVVLAVHHRQPERGGACGEVHVLDVELVVFVVTGQLPAVRIPLATHWGVLVDRYRVRLPALVQRPEGAVDVDARDHDQPDTRRQRGERYLGVGAGEGAAVEGRLRAKAGEHSGMFAQTPAVSVQVLDGGHVVRFEHAARPERHGRQTRAPRPRPDR